MATTLGASATSRRQTITTTAEEITYPGALVCTVYNYGKNASNTEVTGPLYADETNGTPATDNASGDGLVTIHAGEAHPVEGALQTNGTRKFQIRADSENTLARFVLSPRSA